MQKLPIHDVLPNIISTLQHHNRLVLEAPPGAGKTTMVPLALLQAPWLEDKAIIMLEPRRLATRNAAMRMASLLGEEVGQTIGYQIRAERCVSKQSKIIVVTEGILTRMLQSDPALENVAMVIFDEFHERNLHGDLALALSLQSQALLREDLKIMVMSATLNTEAISQLLDDAPLISSLGKSFPVEEYFLDSSTTHPSPRDLPKLMTKQIKASLQNDKGSILAFLPGVKEIMQVQRSLQEYVGAEVIIAPLYGDMSKEAQQRAISKGEKRKVVLATNIAESSLTIEGVSIVIDSGLHRHSSFNSGSGMNRLQTSFISRDAATQRGGRAGRLGPGKCYRLWHQHRPLQQHVQAEVLNSDLTPLVLELANWGVDDVHELQWIDLPPTAALEHAKHLLHQLGALKEYKITPHGQQMLDLGVHPRLAHMILKAHSLGHGKVSTTVAALLSEKEIFKAPARQSTDLSERVDAVLHREHSGSIDRSALHRVTESAKNFRRKLPTSDRNTPYTPEILGLLLAFGYPDRIAKLRGTNDNRYLLANGKGATLAKEDALFNTPFLVITDLDAGRSNARIYSAVALSEHILFETLKSATTIEKKVTWNEEMQRVEAREICSIGAIILEKRNNVKVSKDEIALALINAIKEKGLDVLPWSKEATNLRQRLLFLNYWAQKETAVSEQLKDFPNFSEASLLENIEEWLLIHIEGMSNFKALQKLNMQQVLLGMLTWEQQHLLNTLLPIKIKVPSGSHIVINYQDPAAPTLSVRLQELFGLLETPQLLNNTITLTIELLSPAMRPMQVTKDLKSFWDNTYDEVKKELRGKYKKHYWPDDPYKAIATSKTKKKM